MSDVLDVIDSEIKAHEQRLDYLRKLREAQVSLEASQKAFGESKFSGNDLCDLLEEAGYSPYPYSGRGMMGTQCVGVAERNWDAGSLYTTVDPIRINSLARVMKGIRIDSPVVYWPNVYWPDGRESE